MKKDVRLTRSVNFICLLRGLISFLFVIPVKTGIRYFIISRHLDSRPRWKDDF